MPNPIKYTTGSETLALKKGNFYIGTGDVGKGPSNTTGFYQGISPSSGGYTIYMYKSGAPGDLSYHNAPTDAELISFTNNLAGQSYTTVNECLTYYAGQTDKVCVNRDYEGIVTDGLVLNLDAGFTPSYPKNGTTWYDMGGTNNGTLTNGPTFSTDGGGSIVFDGADDYSDCGNNSVLNFTNNFTLCVWINPSSSQPSPDSGIVGKISSNDEYSGYMLWYNNNTIDLYINKAIRVNSSTSISSNTWYYIVGTYNGTTGRIYINGNIDASENTAVTANATNSNFWVGRYQFGSSRNFSGKIPIVQVYNRALSASEVQQNYNAQKGRFGL